VVLLVSVCYIVKKKITQEGKGDISIRIVIPKPQISITSLKISSNEEYLKAGMISVV
jgi:hypothetical protein